MPYNIKDRKKKRAINYLKNRKKVLMRNSVWEKANPRHRNRTKYHLKKKFNITIEQYDDMRRRQKFKCAICRIDEKYFNKRMVVDHCHSSGVIRGLLCGKCNFLIGFAKDSTKSLSSAIKYLNKSK